MASKRSEDVYGQKVDRCMYNALIKLVSGVGIGIVVSAFLFKRKPWPVILGAGLGTGMGISDCNHEFKGHVPVKPVPVEVTSETS
ncbi:MICOS complex subunit Mic10-like isoform X2 [Biomphalaria glabrata]|uniref:MICOS complex subunit MIC10 n=2 Tax=Biomphalaria TaxID=6525 RepID=A0A2C9KPQ0_BIOGL|nr:MICOS complex subunit Mic10-like isoform X2 [Biomphalaria glabrata]KAI8728313.1 MICOS complex subunit Mic10-like isoform X2 [Biomphalaria glabrata]KAI8747882.1 MICOS complex subunit Mic10 isoform X2 [Biomphalaria glabrata]KAK0065357.1 MICOS complex subunit Mic10-like isoform X2 [Biomphalaria pfeifferi]